MKKTLAILLSLALVICMIPGTALAETATPEALTATINKTSDLYDGSEQTAPTITVNKSDGSVVEAGAETYAVEWKNAAGTVVTKFDTSGTYTATITPTATYKVTPSKFTYTIKPVAFGNATITYSGATTSTNWTGFNSAATSFGHPVTNPGDVSVKLDGLAVNSELYTVATTQEDANRVRITVTPKAVDGTNVTGGARYIYVTMTTPLTDDTFIIKGTNADGSIPDQTWNNGVALTPSVTVVSKADATKKLTAGTDYKLTYTNNTTGGSLATVTATGMGKYEGSIDATFKVVGKDISKLTITSNTTAQGQVPTFVVKDGSTILTEGTHYSINGYDSSTIGANKGAATISGIGNYGGEKKVTFTVIDPNNDLSNATITLGSASPYYSGAVQQASPAVKVTKNGQEVTLTKGTDYTLSYVDANSVTTDSPMNAGTYSVYVTGRGSYAGKVYAGSFTIAKLPLDWTEITLGSSTVNYQGHYVPSVTLKHFANGNVIPATDYTVTYLYVDSAYLTPQVVVTPVSGGNLTTGTDGANTKTKEFSLATRNLSNCIVTFTGNKMYKEYDGAAGFTPSFTIRDTSTGTNLYSGTHYTVTYKNSAGKVVTSLVDADTYTITITGKGAYTGTKTYTYTINGKDISGHTVTLQKSTVTATGLAQTPVIASVKYSYTSSLTANDYTVSYQDAAGKTVTSIVAPGTYKVVVTGKNGYSGSTYALFTVDGLDQVMTIAKTSYKVYEDSDSFKIDATKTGDGTIKYTSMNPSVATVSATGVVTIHKVGRARIVVETVDNVKYDPVQDDVYVKVYPDKAVLSKKPWSESKKALKVRWDYQDGVTKYQVRYSTSKTFKSYKTKTVAAHGKDFETQSTTIKSLTSGKTYYVKVRAVYETYNENGTKITYYGKWSNWKSGKVK